MNIHPLWAVCILVRFSLIFLIRFIHHKYNKPYIKYILCSILLIMGIGFLYKGIIGSNKEIQINRVFWHDSRLLHGMLYIMSSYYLFIDNINLNSITLILDIIFSFLYRFLLNK